MNQRDLFENVASNEPGWLEIQPAPAKIAQAIKARPLPPLDWEGIEGECVHFATRWPNLTTIPGAYGYGWIAGKHWRAHRFAWQEIHGEIPNGLQVRHLCGNPSCVNVEHLKLGTNSDNVRDAIAHGTRNGGIITETERITVYRHALFGIPQRFTARMLGVSQEAISQTAHRWGKPPRPADTMRAKRLPRATRETIAARAKAGESFASLAREFEISRASVQSIAHRRGIEKRPAGVAPKYRAAVNLTGALFP